MVGHFNKGLSIADREKQKLVEYKSEKHDCNVCNTEFNKTKLTFLFHVHTEHVPKLTIGLFIK